MQRQELRALAVMAKLKASVARARAAERSLACLLAIETDET